MNDAVLHQAGQAIRQAGRILVVSHIRPDGDAIGSLLGLGLALEEAGKSVQMVSVDGIPSSFRHLAGSDQVRRQPEGDFDLICVVDCSDLERTGSALKNLLKEGRKPDLNIDHHITNLNYARLNLVAPEKVSTTEVLSELLKVVNLPVSERVAEALLTGLITDTLGFRTANMTPGALRLAADLVERGAAIHELYQRALISRSFEAARFWGAGLSRLQRDGRLVWTMLSLEDRKLVGYPGRDDADLINILSSIDEADISIIFVEQPNGQVKVSWRSQPGFDVSQIALQFGGGGHPAASGAEVAGSLDAVSKQVLQATQPLLERDGRVQSRSEHIKQHG